MMEDLDLFMDLDVEEEDFGDEKCFQKFPKSIFVGRSIVE